MAFKKIDTTARPPRHWALVGYPGSGKSTFAAQMDGPLLIVDADHRFSEVAGLAGGDVYEVSGNPADHVDAGRIAQLLAANMPGAGVRTVVIDSLTSIIAPLVTQAVMDNDAGANKNRVVAFKGRRSPCAVCKMRSRAGAVTRSGFIICAPGWMAMPDRWRVRQSLRWSWPGCGAHSICSYGSCKRATSGACGWNGRGVGGKG